MNTPESDRGDQSLERLLRRSMGAGSVRDATARCVDAETLAAWIDGALTASDAAAVEAHASVCAGCQAVVATLVRMSPPPRQSESWWRRRWIIAGLVPLTAGAAAIAIWVATPGPKESTPIAAAASERAQRTDGASADRVPAPAAALRGGQVEGRTAPGVAGDTHRPAAPGPQRPARSAPPPPLPVPPARQESPSLVDRLDTSAAREQRAPQIAPPPERREKSADAKRDEEATGRLSTLPRSAGSAGAALNETAVVRRRESGVTEIASPEASIRWRIGPLGLIQRSSDGGATWERLSSGATEDLIAAAAPLPTVCWIVGRAGIVLLTTDGRQWRRVAFPERVDLAVIQATDSRAATVTTTDGRRYQTADSGRTWTLLQEF